jgi:hypothetical protein
VIVSSFIDSTQQCGYGRFGIPRSELCRASEPDFAGKLKLMHLALD